MDDRDVQKVTLFVNRRLHGLVKELAKRKRISLGLAYDNALQLYLNQTQNFMGNKRQKQLKGQSHG